MQVNFHHACFHRAYNCSHTHTQKSNCFADNVHNSSRLHIIFFNTFKSLHLYGLVPDQLQLTRPQRNSLNSLGQPSNSERNIHYVQYTQRTPRSAWQTSLQGSNRAQPVLHSAVQGNQSQTRSFPTCEEPRHTEHPSKPTLQIKAQREREYFHAGEHDCKAAPQAAGSWLSLEKWPSLGGRRFLHAWVGIFT